jgi:glycosyltransferase involved in cell wall biosynthesis
LRHLVATFSNALRRDVGALYVPIAQELIPLLRDAGFIACGLFARKPVVIHLHGGTFAEFYRAQPRLIRLLIRHTVGRAAIGITLTERLRPCLECVLATDRVTVVANGVDLPAAESQSQEARPRGRRRASEEGAFHALCLSSQTWQKGTLIFIEGFAAAWHERPVIRGTLAGIWQSADFREVSVELARSLGVADALTFKGPVVEGAKTELISAADVLCLLSVQPEGQPLVLIEAMAAGKPVIATGWPGIRDTVVDRETGLLLSEPDSGALADSLLYLIDRPQERARLGASGRTRYEAMYTQAAFGRRMVGTILPLLDRGPKSARTRAESRVA